MSNLSNNPLLGGLGAAGFTTTPSGASATKRALASGVNAFGAALGVNLGGGLTEGLGGTDIDNQRELFELQLKAQRDLQKFTMITNLAKTEHDSRMAAVRNMRP